MIELWQYPVLLVAGLIAGFVDSIAGGGGLITIPVLLGLGIPPQEALGTNKLQATFGSGSATWHYAKAVTVRLTDCRRGFGLAFLGSVAGTLAVQRTDPDFLRKAIPVLLIAVAVYFIIKPDLGSQPSRPRLTRGWFDLIFGLSLGFYDGFFGPGTGTFWAMAFVLYLGTNLTAATGATKVMNFASNAGSLLLFLGAGKVLFAAGLTMGLGQFLGARMGSRLVIANGSRFIRPVFLTIVFALTAKLLYDGFRK
jgi:uncharacterized membrane protein YfcA